MIKVQKILSDRDFKKYHNKARLYEAEDFETLTEDAGDDDTTVKEDKLMTDEELKIESLKIATNIAKLLTDVTAQDIVTIAGTVSGFIKNYQVASDNGMNVAPTMNAQPAEPPVEDVDFADADLGDENTEETPEA